MTREDIEAIVEYVDKMALTMAQAYRTGEVDTGPCESALVKLRARARPVTSQSPIIPD